jgi:uncharacterized protein (TIGR02453 family)
MAVIKKESIDFLKALSKNNNRDWFSAHKPKYEKAHENIVAFADALLVEMNKHDHIETASGKKSLYRIYKDVRFSKDKTPYSTYWGGGFRRATKQLRGGYYFHIEPGNTYLAGGFFSPSTDDLQRIRQDIDLNYDEWRKMLSQKTLVNTFGNLIGSQLTSAPRGYAKDHPAIDLLRYKQFYLKHKFTDKDICSPDFVKKVSDGFKKLRPYFDYMSEVLTTDTNGVSII